ncbi:hypothetical protein E1B28_007077 [Marasmius oreades]|uniref:Flavin reductase like domain-containing protein n=1 Tax=Marasmius oreades TaxID=181124 RepID=A0A9P7S298_9AGAR|nr:uncharacterized protein E1B28_007077 [Marasmius oreades]KAG7093396.1 hypothetical protein E1B28_007077 [Marasmius oreades]
MFCVRRQFSSSIHESTLHLKAHFRSLLRESAQTVAVVTTTTAASPSSTSHDRHHGATLSSFTSIAMDPYPLISFSLRLPSRMAAYLAEAYSKPLSHPESAHMVINLLSATQEDLAVVFSRPDLHPHPFSSSEFYSFSREGIPVLKRSLGAISCQLVAPPIPLHDLEFLKHGFGGGTSMAEEGRVVGESDGVTSELFIARVVDVEMDGITEGVNVSGLEKKPLLYHRRGYTTCYASHTTH